MKIPLIERGLCWGLGLGSVVMLGTFALFLGSVIIQSRSLPLLTYVAYFIFSLLIVGIAGQCIYILLRYRHTDLVLDHQGIWLEGHARRGLFWEDITGYDLPKKVTEPAIRIRGRDGQRVDIPLILGFASAAHLGAVSRALDRCLGPDGDRPSLKIPTETIDARLQHHYGAIPPVEMEHDVVYRYIDPEKLASEAIDRITLRMPFLSFIVPSLLITFRTGFPLWIVLTAAALLATWFGLYAVRDILLARGFRDRFIRRGDEIWRIRNGREMRLSPSALVSRPYVLNHPTTTHGQGFFAYRMAPQFLEPDV